MWEAGGEEREQSVRVHQSWMEEKEMEGRCCFSGMAEISRHLKGYMQDKNSTMFLPLTRCDHGKNCLQNFL